MNIARLAGIFYLLTFVTGVASLLLGSGMVAANAIATISYVGVTVLFYWLFKPVDARLSLIAALFSAAGCTLGGLSAFHLAPAWPNPLVFFGVYCLLIGFLIYRSTYLPRALGILMAIGGVSWLTFGVAAMAKALYPYNLAPGIIGEGALTIWLLLVRVNVPARAEQPV
jgi:hypothetical protein